MQKMNRNDLGQNKEKQGCENKDERWTVIQEEVVLEKKKKNIFVTIRKRRGEQEGVEAE